MKDKKASNNPGKKNNLSTGEENDFLKAKLSAEYGAQFSESSKDLPEEVENEWLNYIQAFEEARKNPKYCKAYDRIGKPGLKKTTDLSETEISKELEKVLEKLDEFNIYIDFLDEYEDRIKYQFIIDELFDYEMEVIEAPGLYSHFIYEEFHPNPLLDARDAIHEIVSGINEKSEAHFSTWRFHEEGIIDSKGQTINSKEIDKRFVILQETIESLTIEDFGKDEIKMESDTKAVYTNQIHYHYKMAGETEWTEINTTIKLELKPSKYAPMWGIIRMEFPGAEL